MIKSKFRLERRKAIAGWGFISPWIVGFAVFMAYPFIKSIGMSFSKITDIATLESEFVGFDNFLYAFTVDVNFLPMFLETVTSTVLWTPVIVVFSLFIAVLINGNIRGKGIFKSVFFLPVLLGNGYVLKQFLDMGVTGTGGILTIPDSFYQLAGDVAGGMIVSFIGQLTVILWKSCIQIVLFLAALQSVPDPLYESARVDAASEWVIFWKITLPMISPIVLLNCIYTLIDFFRDISNPIVDYIIQNGVKSLNYSYGAAMGWVYFLFIFVVVIVVFAGMRNLVFYNDER